ncbi:uncharacterized protein K460DRAFT_345953 [Cucurbitaria berberidis CBS 394.84]|uniref:WD40 repeat-like protein n=1 Tax=Cucurbitaria berberidis CBS 394.84 TaxID=1168544 RepID=A0A9P4GAX8_9PLEO|nr:uncharacterized protein K460DRAFT_345953 [Cucurbitaria berberidis CBS 394.84]KAF1842267.1 hypothetical protein K460DRAFT_345953 [Cucurbitaria berberidis CBS 394.84]
MALIHQLPIDHSLFITTPNAIQYRSQLIDKSLFECETASGIVNACASKDNSGLTSVQAYSIPAAELLPSLPSHPSPPNTIAVSCNGDVLLSASPDPPMIYLHDRRWGGSAPVNFQPIDAHSPINCAVFHSSDGLESLSHTSFVLGFQDGSLAMYRLLVPPLSKYHKGSHTHRFQPQPLRVGALKKLHKAAMGGITAAALIPGYKSRVVSIGQDGRCRLHVSGPAICVSVVSDRSISSNIRNEKVLLLRGEATEDAGQVYEGLETLIAIGTQAGKVLVFNVLGLLIYEIAMGVPIVNVEWVGDMSAPSVLPNRKFSLSPEPRPVTDRLSKEIEVLTDEESGTVMKTASPFKRVGEFQAIPTAYTRDLFTNDLPQRMSRQSTRKRSDASSGSPLQVNRTHERPRRKSLIRPRIATETFESPVAAPRLPMSNSRAKSSSLSAPPLQESRRWPQVHQAPNVPPSSKARRLSASYASFSSQGSVSDQEFFTPPSTQRDKGKTPQRCVSQQASVTASKSSARFPPPLRSVSPDPSNIPSRLNLRPASQTFNPTFGTNQAERSAGPSIPAPKTPQRHVTIDAPGSSSSLDSLYSRPTSRVVKEASRRRSSIISTRTPQLTRPMTQRSDSSPKYLDGEMDEPKPKSASRARPALIKTSRRDFSYESGQRFEMGRRERVFTSVDEMQQLRDNTEMLRDDMQALREEFRALKDVLLGWRAGE